MSLDPQKTIATALEAQKLADDIEARRVVPRYNAFTDVTDDGVVPHCTLGHLYMRRGWDGRSLGKFNTLYGPEPPPRQILEITSEIVDINDQRAGFEEAALSERREALAAHLRAYANQLMVELEG
jgi:hypothetical protein